MKQRSGNLHPFKNKIFTCEDLCLCTDMQMKKRFSLESSTGMENFMVRNLNWAVLGTGVIANEMAQALNTMGKKLYAVGNRTHEKAVKFAEKY